MAAPCSCLYSLLLRYNLVTIDTALAFPSICSGSSAVNSETRTILSEKVLRALDIQMKQAFSFTTYRVR